MCGGLSSKCPFPDNILAFAWYNRGGPRKASVNIGLFGVPAEILFGCCV
jgi:hypothetical protein